MTNFKRVLSAVRRGPFAHRLRRSRRLDFEQRDLERCDLERCALSLRVGDSVPNHSLST
jgi:hypothetical protein